MRSIVGEKFEATRRKSQQALDRKGMAGVPGGGGYENPLGLGTGGGSYGFGYKRTDMTVHLEQYRHNTGWVAAAIRPIAQRIARQPVHLAQVRKEEPKKGMPGFVRKTSGSGRASKPWEDGLAEANRNEAAATLWFKQFLPASMKGIAPHAEIVDVHPFLDAIDNPNPIMVRWSLFFVTVASLLLTGKGYWWVKTREVEGPDAGTDGEKSEDRGKIDIWPLPSHWVRPVHTEERLNDHWEVTPDGALEPTPVPQEQIIYFYLPDPSALLSAQSPLQHQSRAVVSDEAIAEAQRRAFANGIFPGMAVIVGRQPDINGNPGERPALNREQRAQIVTAVKQAYRGVYQADEPIILDRLIEDVKRITNNPREMDFMDSGRYTKERILQGFGTSPAIMGDVETPNKASSAAADDHFCENTVNPLIEMISQVLSQWLNNLLGTPLVKYYLFIEESQGKDADSELARWEALYDRGACSRDEIRAGLMKLAPMAGGKTCLVESTLTAIDARLATDPAAPLAPAAPPQDPSGSTGSAPKPADPARLPMLSPGAPTPPSSGPPQPIDQPTSRGYSRQSSDAKSGRAVAFVETLFKMARLRLSRAAAEAVLMGSFAEIPPQDIHDAVDVCVKNGVVCAPDPKAIYAVVRIIKGDDALEDANPADTRSAVTIPVPEVFQETDFDCGAAACYAAADALLYQPDSYDDFLEELEVEPQFGTLAINIYRFFDGKGGNVLQRDKRNIEWLRQEIRRDRLCLCPVQYFESGDAFGGEGGASEGPDGDKGHWVLVHGYTRNTILYMCPINGYGEIDSREFLHNWYDKQQDGTPLVRFCLSVGRAPRHSVDVPGQGNEHAAPKSVKLVDASGHEHAADGKFGKGGGSVSGHNSAADKPTSKPGEAVKPAVHVPVSAGGHDTGSVKDAPDVTAKKAAGILNSIKGHGAKAVAVAQKVGYHMKTVAIAGAIHAVKSNVAEDICDTAHDYSKIINAKGTGDWLSENLGVSGNFAAGVSSKVLSYGYTKLKEYVARRHIASQMLPTKPRRDAATDARDGDDDGRLSSVSIGEAAQQIYQIQLAVFGAMGCPPDQLPSLKDVTDWLVKKHDPNFTASDE